MKISIKTAILTFASFAWATAVFSPVLARAQEYQATPCDEAQYSAIGQLPGGALDVYAKAGRKEDAFTAEIYYKFFDGEECIKAGSVQLDTKTYHQAGKVTLPEGTNTVSVFVKINTQSDMSAGASIPQVVFADAAKLPCDLTTGCGIKYENQLFTLSPKKVSLSTDTLRVGLLLPFANDIKEVRYTVDGKPAYIKPSLEEFNLNYVPDGEHTLARTIVLKDGQSLTDSKVIKRGLEGGATYLFISMLYGQSRLLRYIGITLGFLIVYTLITLIIKQVVARRRWKSEHFFNPNEHFDISAAGAHKGLSGEESYGQILRHYKKFFVGGLVLITGIFAINTYALTFFTVDGVSMFPTLQNQSKHLLLTLPVSIGKVNKNYYLPTRGTIVVVQKDDNNLFESADTQEKHYVVKRIVGLPKDRVVIKNGKILIYNKENEKGYEPDAEFKWVKDLTGSESISMDITLKEGEVFVVGDNRDESIDSRYYGPVMISQVIGKVL